MCTNDVGVAGSCGGHATVPTGGHLTEQEEKQRQQMGQHREDLDSGRCPVSKVETN